MVNVTTTWELKNMQINDLRCGEVIDVELEAANGGFAEANGLVTGFDLIE